MLAYRLSSALGEDVTVSIGLNDLERWDRECPPGLAWRAWIVGRELRHRNATEMETRARRVTRHRCVDVVILVVARRWGEQEYDGCGETAEAVEQVTGGI